MTDPTRKRSFEMLAYASHKQRESQPPEGCILSIDPGHTTGFGVFRGLVLLEAGQKTTKSIEQATTELAQLIQETKPDVIVVEDYRVYKWKTDEHANSDLLTSRIIGCIETLTTLSGIEVVKQPASVAKHFCTDPKLREWGMYVQGMKHARDAIRHGAYYILFGKVKNKCRTGTNNLVG